MSERRSMKKAAIVTNARSSTLSSFLRKNLETILSGYATLESYYIENLGPGDLDDADVVLVMNKTRLPDVLPWVKDTRRVIVIQRTILEKEIYSICAIPPGTRVLVVNDNLETTQELTALLYKLDIQALNLVIYEEGRQYQDIRIAITPAESWRVPTSVSTVIDIGHRHIDIATFIKIANLLNIQSPELSRRILKYSESLVDVDSGVKAQYRELFQKNLELDAVVNLSHEGLLLLNNEGVVSLYNRSLSEMLDLRKDIRGSAASEVLPKGLLTLLHREAVEDEVFEHKGRTLLINKRPIEHFGENAGAYVNIQEVTYIRQLEQNLSRKLSEKGMVARYRFSDMVAHSPQMRKCIDLAAEIARSDLTVLITGESGTGKELLAQSIHNVSVRAKQPFVAFNCAAVTDSLMESELFGYEGGSFTGALKEGKAGLFEQANHGTIFLDEIGDMSLALQVKLLRVLQERQIMRIGSQRVNNVDIRMIAATNHDLRAHIRLGTFREDLYYRLNVLPLRVPPLRERSGEVVYLMDHFLALNGAKELSFTADAQKALINYRWPGNIRELSNVASYVSFLAKGTVALEQLPHYLLEGEENFPSQLASLSRRCDPDLAVEVLKILSSCAERNRGAGRSALVEALAETGRSATEGQLRRILAVLSEEGLISSQVGRKGSEISSKGAAFLRLALRR